MNITVDVLRRITSLAITVALRWLRDMIFLQVVLFFVLALPTSRARCLYSEPTSTCLILFNSFQSALVGRELNLFKLSKTFFPITLSVPDMVNVSYSVTIAPRSDEACPRSKESVKEEAMFTNNTHFSINFAWTDKIFYTLLHPAMINRLQPQIMQATLSTGASLGTALTWNGVGSFLTIQLELNPVLLPCIPAKVDIVDTLTYITAHVRKIILCYIPDY